MYRKYKCNLESTVLLTAGSLKNNDGDGTKTALKSEVTLLQSSEFKVRQTLETFLELNSKRLNGSSGIRKERESHYLVFTKREIWHFHVIVVVQ